MTFLGEGQKGRREGDGTENVMTERRSQRKKKEKEPEEAIPSRCS